MPSSTAAGSVIAPCLLIAASLLFLKLRRSSARAAASFQNAPQRPRLVRAAASSTSHLDGKSPLPGRPLMASGAWLRLITVNDVYTLENYPQLCTAIKLAQAEEGCVVKSFINGDFLSPCLISALDAGKAMLQALNEVGIDFACLGNHEVGSAQQHCAQIRMWFDTDKICVTLVDAV